MRRVLALVLLVALVAGCGSKAVPDSTPPAGNESAHGGNIAVYATNETLTPASTAPSPSSNETSPPPAENETPSTPPPEPPAPPTPDPAPNLTTSKHYAGTFDLSITEAPLLGAGPAPQQKNCVVLSSNNTTRLLSGMAIANWTAAAPTAATLALGEGTFANGTANVTGDSPLQLPLRGTILPPDAGGAFAGFFPAGRVAVQVDLPSDPAFAAQQAVKLTLSFDYTGPDPTLVVDAC